MGMFDYVKYEADCYSCGEPITGWQSKSGRCELQTLTPEELLAQSDEYNTVFYEWCDGCKAENLYRVKPAKAVSVELVAATNPEGEQE